MTHVDIDDFECPCDNKIGNADLNIKNGIYTCGRCGKEHGKIQRPEEYKNENLDCTVRALSKATGKKYSEVHDAWNKVGRKNRKRISAKNNVQKVCNILGVKAKQVKRSGNVNKFIKQNPEGNFFCLKRSHAFAINNGMIYDLSNTKSHLKGAWEIK